MYNKAHNEFSSQFFSLVIFFCGILTLIVLVVEIKLTAHTTTAMILFSQE